MNMLCHAFFIINRCRTHDNEEDNSSDKLYKGDVEIEDLDNRLSNIESGENLVKCNELYLP
jgi:hypothetical protein